MNGENGLLLTNKPVGFEKKTSLRLRFKTLGKVPNIVVDTIGYASNEMKLIMNSGKPKKLMELRVHWDGSNELIP